MLGLTQQERKVVQLLLFTFLIGLAVTAYKKVRIGNSWQRLEEISQTPTQIEDANNLNSTVENSSGYKEFQTGQPIDVSKQAASSLSQFAAKLDINSASESELATLPGIGPALANRIVVYRQQNGKFQNIEAVKKVKGIGDKKFEKIRELISVE